MNGTGVLVTGTAVSVTVDGGEGGSRVAVMGNGVVDCGSVGT